MPRNVIFYQRNALQSVGVSARRDFLRNDKNGASVSASAFTSDTKYKAKLSSYTTLIVFGSTACNRAVYLVVFTCGIPFVVLYTKCVLFGV